MSAAFFDSNIVVYSIDPDPQSQGKADVSRELLQTRTIVLSTQVLMETFNTLRRMKIGTIEESTAFVEALADEIVIGIEAQDVVRGIRRATRDLISHWDALILQAAQKAGVDILYSEDLNHGQTYGNVRVCNPFIEDFLADS